jgi:hypothetical protein
MEKDFNLIGSAGSTGAYNDLIKNDPMMATAALSAQWENLKTSIGVAVVPIILPAMRGLTSAFNALGQFLNAHPTITSALVVTFTGLSALAAIGGTLMIAGAGIKLIGAGFGLISGLPLAGMASGLTVFAAALAALAPIVYHQQIANALDSTSWGQWIGDKLLAAKDFSYGDMFSGKNAGPQYSMAPPSSGKSVQVNTQINLDGRAVANAVTTHQVNAMNGPATSGSGFDTRESYVPSGVSGAW